MSMVSSDKLSHAVAEYGVFMPNELLSFTNQGIKTALKQDEKSENATRDGMDVAIITYDSKLNKLYYSGAHRSLMILEDGEISEIKATKVAVGGFTPMDQKFDLHEIDIKPNQTFYMTTDGYADQFGGVKGKKLKIKALKQTIIDNGNRSMDEQKNVLNQVIVDWMDGYEQVDDICVIGVRFK
jgi:serine phosphatase RsbU (regulator of sigma subunit)